MARKYDLRCPVARAINAVGDGWSTLILRDLYQKKTCKFQDFQRSLQGVVPSTLSHRLKRLEADGLIEREIYSEHPVRMVYKLSSKGKSLGPVLLALRRWGQQNP